MDEKPKMEMPKWYSKWMALREHSVLFSLACVIAGFFLYGIASALFSDFFGACSIALKNTSHGLFLKIVDVLYIKAAKTDLTELMQTPSIIIQMAFVAMPLFSLDAIRRSMRDAEGLLKRTENVDEEIDQIKNLETKKRSVGEELESLTKENETVRAEVNDILRFLRRAMRIGRIVAVVLVALFLFDFTYNILARSLFREYQWQVLTVRPYISDMEYHKLNRDWALMQGRSDYQKVSHLLDEYAKRDADRQDASTRTLAK